MRKIRLATKILGAVSKNSAHYPAKLFANALVVVARCGILLVIYKFVFDLRGDSIAGTSFIFVAWSIFFYFAINAFGVSNISRSIMTDIRSGSVETILSKPISYLWYKTWWQFGNGLYSLLISLVAGSAILWIMVGIPDTMQSAFFVFTFLLTFLGSIVLYLLIHMLVGILAFWIEDITPIHWITSKFILILGGSFLPVAFFPDFMYKLAIYSPFGASQFITHTVYESWQTKWYTLIAIQLAWICVMYAIIDYAFKRAQKNISVNGG